MSVPFASPYLDPDRRPPTVEPARVQALCDEGVEPLQARFAALVMHLGGLFMRDHVDEWLSRHWKAFPDKGDERKRESFRMHFLQPLYQPVGRRKALAVTRCLPGKVVEPRYGHFCSRHFYGVLGLPHCRYARNDDERSDRRVQRLLAFDYMVEHPEYTWYCLSQAREALFRSLRLPESVLPARDYRGRHNAAPTVRVPFVHHVPVGVGDWSVVFVVPFPHAGGGSLPQVCMTHRRLWQALRARGFRVTVVVAVKDNTPLPNLIQGQGPTRADEEALVYGVWRYVLQLAVEFRDAEILAAQGGTDGVRRSYEDALRRVDRLVKAVPAAPMEIRHHVSRCVANVPYSELRGAGP